METIYIFLLSLRIFLAVGCMVLSFMISRIPFASTVTYRLFSLGYLLLVLTYMNSLLFVPQIASFLSGFNGMMVYINQGMQCLFVLVMFIGLNRKYFAVRALLPTIESESSVKKKDYA